VVRTQAQAVSACGRTTTSRPWPTASLRMLPVGIMLYQGEFAFPWPAIAAALIVSIISVAVLIVLSRSALCPVHVQGRGGCDRGGQRHGVWLGLVLLRQGRGPRVAGGRGAGEWDGRRKHRSDHQRDGAVGRVKQSGLGRERSEWGTEDFLSLKYIGHGGVREPEVQ
jgi:hypothetical protein